MSPYGIYSDDEDFIYEKNVVHLYVIENGKILSGRDLREKSLSNYDISILSGKMKISETLAENIRESCSLKPTKEENQREHEDDNIISSSHDHEGCHNASGSPQNNFPARFDEVS